LFVKLPMLARILVRRVHDGIGEKRSSIRVLHSPHQIQRRRHGCTLITTTGNVADISRRLEYFTVNQRFSADSSRDNLKTEFRRRARARLWRRGRRCRRRLVTSLRRSEERFAARDQLAPFAIEIDGALELDVLALELGHDLGEACERRLKRGRFCSPPSFPSGSTRAVRSPRASSTRKRVPGGARPGRRAASHRGAGRSRTRAAAAPSDRSPRASPEARRADARRARPPLRTPGRAARRARRDVPASRRGTARSSWLRTASNRARCVASHVAGERRNSASSATPMRSRALPIRFCTARSNPAVNPSRRCRRPGQQQRRIGERRPALDSLEVRAPAVRRPSSARVSRSRSRASVRSSSSRGGSSVCAAVDGVGA